MASRAPDARMVGGLALVAWALCCPVIARADDPASDDFFEKRVRPLLVERCQRCHGEKMQRAGLRLDSREALLAGGDTGPAVVPGKPEDSEIFRRVTAPDGEERMPPADEAARLSADEIMGLRQWIASGAAWPAGAAPAPDVRALAHERHWAFKRIARPTPPPVVGRPDVEHPIDRFVLSRLQAAGLEPAPEADRQTLVRRATYDLTGLPPSYEEVTAFVADESPGAFSRLVERLLESLQYGEHWGRHWLDVSRYADTKGYVYGREERFFVHSAAYRDWVIRAFNDELPYDRFVTLQLAADLAAPDDPAALAALGFLTVGRRFLGLDPDIIDDRIDVVGRGLLGLTVGCARCHDHKYDPIPISDYYSLYGVFQNCVERKVPLPPGKPLTPEFAQGLAERQAKAAELLSQRRTEGMTRIRSRIAEYLLAQLRFEEHGSFTTIVGGNDLLPDVVHRFEAYLAAAARDADPVFLPWIALARLRAEELPAAAVDLCRRWQEPGAGVHPRVAQAFVTAPGSHRDAAERYAALFAAVESEWNTARQLAAAAGRPEPTALDDPDAESLRQFLHGPASPCTIPDEPLVNIEFYFATGTTVELWKLDGEVDRWLTKHPDSQPMATVLVDRDVLEEPRIFRRGNPFAKAAFVPRRAPAVIVGADRRPFVRGSGRMELAAAIVSPDNPLTARVWVNRVWMHHFGHGLVETPSDFGIRSMPPSHPELLDWLASEFMAHGWSTKWLHRVIMSSATYRQSCSGPATAGARDQAVEKDPDNRLLWRMHRRRLSFEQMRDSLIVVAGQLDATHGGAAVPPFAAGPAGFRRSVYTLVDRQYLPPTLAAFDFANPDLHTPQRGETTVPQQALFALNSAFVADRARAVARLDAVVSDPQLRLRRLFRQVLRRDPTPADERAGLDFIAAAAAGPARAAGGLDPWEQLAQVLLVSNEFMFVE